VAETVAVCGGSGFVGRHLVDRLRQDGHVVRAGTRDVHRAGAVRPGLDWTRLDVDDVESLDRAFDGATVVVYLVHRMRDGAHLVSAEEDAAGRVLRAAEKAGVGRIVYLGGPDPGASASEHLIARIRTGEVLRGGRPATTELRAGMVVGAGSESFLIVRDLALRLPIMVLPSWLQSRSQPVWLGDVTSALAHACTRADAATAWHHLPGPEALTAEQILRRVAARVGMRPVAVRVPVLTPALSAQWIRLVSRADYTVARRLVDGLTVDLVAPDDGYWSFMPGHQRVGFDEAVDRALTAEARLRGVALVWETVARRVALSARPELPARR
jgi:uncharacterized protein YbjT (DUF2867 family)